MMNLIRRLILKIQKELLKMVSNRLIMTCISPKEKRVKGSKKRDREIIKIEKGKGLEKIKLEVKLKIRI